MKTHPLSVTHLVMGLVFLGIAGSWVLRTTEVIEADDLTWLFPMALVIAGGVGLVAAMAKGVRGRRPEQVHDEYVPTYDAPLPQDYTSDIDRKLHDAETGTERTAVITTTDTTDSTARIDKENDR